MTAVSPTPEEAAATLERAKAVLAPIPAPGTWLPYGALAADLVAAGYVLLAALRDARREASMAASNLSLAEAYRTEANEQTLRADLMERERDQAREALDRILDFSNDPVVLHIARAALGGAAEEPT